MKVIQEVDAIQGLIIGAHLAVYLQDKGKVVQLSKRALKDFAIVPQWIRSHAQKKKV
jgi:hypothetical protein